MKKKNKNKRMIILGIIIGLAAAVVIWFRMDYSPLRHTFESTVQKRINVATSEKETTYFTEKEFENMPLAIQNYIAHCGYLGTEKKLYFRMEYQGVDFMQSKNGPALTIDYAQVNFADKPDRIAMIDSAMFGIPFQGYDYYENGSGGMKGVLAKGILLFDQKGEAMNQACLVTYLSECLLMPAALFQDGIKLTEVDDYSVEVDMTYGGQTVSGVYRFNDAYEFVSFETDSRAQIANDGTTVFKKWIARCSDYCACEDGILRPGRLMAIWMEEDGEFVYFDGQMSSFQN